MKGFWKGLVFFGGDILFLFFLFFSFFLFFCFENYRKTFLIFTGPILETKGMHVIFQKKGEKCLKKGKKGQNLWKFGQKCTKLENFLKKGRWLLGIITRNKLLWKGPAFSYQDSNRKSCISYYWYFCKKAIKHLIYILPRSYNTGCRYYLFALWVVEHMHLTIHSFTNL